MVKIKPELDIDCGKETCSKCKYRSYGEIYYFGDHDCHNGLCLLFKKNVRDFKYRRESYRLPECLAAETNE